MKTIIRVIALSFFSLTLYAQTMYVPSGTAGIGSSTNSNVGIGTNAPAFSLEAVGTGALFRNTSTTSYSTLRLYNNNNLNTRALEIDYSGSAFVGSLLTSGPAGESASIATTGAYPLAFGTNNAVRMTLLPSGLVGIGTITPASRLHVAGLGSTNIDLTVTGRIITGDSGNAGGLWVNSTQSMFMGQSSATAMGWYNNGAWRVILDNAGNLGVGTATPANRFEVQGGNLQIGGGAVVANASLHIRAGDITTGRLTQFSPAGASKPGLNLVAGTDATSTALWWSWGVKENGVWAMQPTTTFTGSSGMFIDRNGNVGIGTASPNQKLTVNGIIYSREVKVDLSVPGPDYVFDKSYELRSLEEVKSYIDTNKHLPEIPSAKEMEANGIELSNMNMLLLKKVEELTLYMIELKKVTELQQKEIESLRKEVNR